MQNTSETETYYVLVDLMKMKGLLDVTRSYDGEKFRFLFEANSLYSCRIHSSNLELSFGFPIFISGEGETCLDWVIFQMNKICLFNIS